MHCRGGWGLKAIRRNADPRNPHGVCVEGLFKKQPSLVLCHLTVLHNWAVFTWTKVWHWMELKLYCNTGKAQRENYLWIESHKNRWYYFGLYSCAGELWSVTLYSCLTVAHVTAALLSPPVTLRCRGSRYWFYIKSVLPCIAIAKDFYNHRRLLWSSGNPLRPPLSLLLIPALSLPLSMLSPPSIPHLFFLSPSSSPT